MTGQAAFGRVSCPSCRRRVRADRMDRSLKLCPACSDGLRESTAAWLMRLLGLGPVLGAPDDRA